MKKLLILFVAAIATLGLTACGETTEATTTTEEATTTTTVSETTTVEDATVADLYEGTHTVTAMGSDVTYHYTLGFEEDGYVFHSSFVMGGETYAYDETGTYAIAGGTLTLTPSEGDPVTGEIQDGSIEIAIQASSMASRETHVLTAVVLARKYIGTHTVTAMGSDVVYVYHLDAAFGTYNFESHFEMGGEDYSYYETGTYSVDGDTITITPDGGDPVTGSILGDGEIEIPIKPSDMGDRALQTLTETQLSRGYEGTHTVSAMGSDVVYDYTIIFGVDTYTFHSEFEMDGTPYTYDETGTYSVDGNTITITPDGGDAATGTVLEDGMLELPIKASSMADRGLQTLHEITE